MGNCAPVGTSSKVPTITDIEDIKQAFEDTVNHEKLATIASCFQSCSTKTGLKIPTITDVEDLKQAVQEVEDTVNNEKLATIVSCFQSENEKMKQKLSALKNQNVQNAIAEAERIRQNEEVVKELESIKSLMAQKDEALVLHKLRAALHTKASTLMSTDAFSVKLHEGKLIKYRKAGKTKTNNERWVELYFIPGESRCTEFVEGHLMLTYAENKESQISNRGRVLKLIDEPTNVDAKGGEQFFSALLRVNGQEKEMVFACCDEKEREDWVRACNEGLSRIEQEVKAMNEKFTLKIEFTKEKLGFVVEENYIDITKSNVADTSKVNQEQGSVSAEDKKVREDNEISIEDKKVRGPNEEYKDLDSKMTQVEVNQEENEPPCWLTVYQINDDELLEKGLVENCVLRAVDDWIIEGKMSYSYQINILETTKKPFVITFTGQNYMKKKTTTAPLYSSILNELTADGVNAAKSAFSTLIKGSPLEKQLADSGDNSTEIIKDVLSNQRWISTLLRNNS